MTLPDERYRSVKWAAEFLSRLAGGDIPRVPRAVRDEARSILRHYPGQWDLKRLEAACPEVVQERMDSLHRMVVSYGTERGAEDSDEDSELLRGYKE